MTAKKQSITLFCSLQTQGKQNESFLGLTTRVKWVPPIFEGENPSRVSVICILQLLDCYACISGLNSYMLIKCVLTIKSQWHSCRLCSPTHTTTTGFQKIHKYSIGMRVQCVSSYLQILPVHKIQILKINQNHKNFRYFVYIKSLVYVKCAHQKRKGFALFQTAGANDKPSALKIYKNRTLILSFFFAQAEIVFFC